MKSQVWETKEVEKNVNLNVILTCNINLDDNIHQNHDI